MTWLWVALAVLAGLSVGLDAFAWRNLRRTRRLRDAPASLGKTPRVSVIMAARNESASIGPALAARLADTYPSLEFILVDDRSTDRTGEIAGAAAASDARLSVVRIDELPEGWLGKVHALAEGVRHATGDYLLFSDADVSVSPDATTRAVGLCEAEAIDCLGLIPEYHSPSVLVGAAWTVFVRLLCMAMGLPRLSEPKAPTVVGSGAFTLVRRSAYDRTPGLEDLRMETGDDMALAVMIQTAGGHCETVFGSGCARVQMYESTNALLLGIEKNGSTGAASPGRVCGGLAAFALLDTMPLIAALTGPMWLRGLGVCLSLLAWTANVAILRTTCRQWAPALLWPVGTFLLAYATSRATALAKVRGGVTWRGTFYPLAELQAGRRYTL